MKIEVGKFYKDREGSKVRIYAVDGYGINPIHGACESGSGEWLPQTWCSDGRVEYVKSLGYFPQDIVSEWIDPKPRMFAWIEASGRVRLYSEEVLSDEPPWTRAPWLDEPGDK